MNLWAKFVEKFRWVWYNLKIFIEIAKYKQWAEGLIQNGYKYGCGEWECEYNDWGTIYSEFENIIKNSTPEQYTKEELMKLIYILARDNEDEFLADIIVENQMWLICLCEYSFLSDENDARWQLAVRAKYIQDKAISRQLLERYVNDSDEYVNRRALMELAEVLPDKVEYYSCIFWDRDIYGDLSEYQRMAVLEALKKINSELLSKYLEEAQKDGRKYLVSFASKIKENPIV